MASRTTPTRQAGVVSSLLDAIFAAPDDDEPRRVYADALSEAGDPRGELIAVQCEIASLRYDDPKRAPLEKRAGALLKAHKAAWTFGIRGLTFRRGFVEEVKVPLEEASRYRPLFAREPVTKLILAGGEHRGTVEALLDFRFDALRQVRSEIARKAAGKGLAELVQLPSMANLDDLSLFRPAIDEKIATAIVEAPALESLTILSLAPVRPALSAGVVSRLRERFGDRLLLL